MKILAYAMLLLASVAVMCCSQADTLPQYDERPANHKPTQTAFARDRHYDILDYESYDSYVDPLLVDEPDGLNVRFGWYRLYKTEDATYLAETFFVPQDYWFFMFSSQSAIIDEKTGDTYMLRHVEYYPTDTCLWIRNAAGRYVQFIHVYPPLPDEVETVQLFTPGMPSRDTFDGTAERITGLKVNDLRKSTINRTPLKQGDIIR